jgi:phospholipase C
MTFNRRDFLKGASTAALAGLVPTIGSRRFGFDPQRDRALSPDQSGIEHIIVVMMENRSFDHYLGWVPGTNGRQSGLQYPDQSGKLHSTYPLAPDWKGCGHPDPDHSYGGGRIEYDRGEMDGFLLDPNNDIYCIGYYEQKDIPFYGALALNYTTLSQSFASILAPTFPNRMFLNAAQTDRLDDSFYPSLLPTIWDNLKTAGVSANYYYSNVPFLGLWGAKYVSISKTYSEFLSDAKNGTLPSVSFVDPSFTILDIDLGTDAHPHDDIRRGDAFLSQTFQAVAQSPVWDSSVVIISFDEWGGFFEHVAPPRAIAPNDVDKDLVDGKALLGFRVPTVIASPFSLGNPNSPRVNDEVYDHTSILKLIEWRWNVPPLTKRDSPNDTDVNNMLDALDLSNPQTTVPKLPHPSMPFPLPCLESERRPTEWDELIRSGLLKGWTLPSSK